MSWRNGVDIGGTFTDAALVNEESGAIGIANTLPTPDDFGQGVVNALTEAIKTYGVQTGDVSLLSHATTVVTNAILEEKGARTALIATKGSAISLNFDAPHGLTFMICFKTRPLRSCHAIAASRLRNVLMLKAIS